MFLRNEKLALVKRLLGFTTDEALGRAIGMNRITISRARNGVIGEQFIAAFLDFVGKHADELKKLGVGVGFEDLFELRPKPIADRQEVA